MNSVVSLGSFLVFGYDFLGEPDSVRAVKDTLVDWYQKSSTLIEWAFGEYRVS